MFVLVTALAAACGGSTGSPSGTTGIRVTLSVIQAAASATAKANSMRVAGTMSVNVPNAGKMSMSMLGDVQTKPLLARITASGVEISGQSFGTMKELLTSDALYVNLSALADRLGKPWVVVRFNDLKATSGLNIKRLFTQAEQMQPAQYIQQLAAAGSITDEGSANVDGVHTTHYSGTVSSAELVQNYSADLRAQMSSTLRQAGITGERLDAWVDGQGLVRRIAGSTIGGSGDMRFSFDISHYGERVRVNPPAADQVADFSALAGG